MTERRAPSVVPKPANRGAMQMFGATAAARFALAARVGRVCRDAFSGPWPGEDHATELVAEHERTDQARVADPGPAIPVQVRAAQADGRDPEEDLARAWSRDRLPCQLDVARPMQPRHLSSAVASAAVTAAARSTPSRRACGGSGGRAAMRAIGFALGSRVKRLDGHRRDGLERDRVVGGRPRVRAPRERPMRGDQDCRHLDGIQARRGERLHDDRAGSRLVFARHLLVTELARDRYGPVEMVSVGRAEGRDRPARLRPRRGSPRMRVDDSPDLRIRPVERQMGRRVRRWPQRVADRLARVEIDRDEVLRPQVRIRDAARLDDHQVPVTVDATGIAERQGHQARPHDRLVRGPDRVAQRVRPAAAHRAVTGRERGGSKPGSSGSRS